MPPKRVAAKAVAKVVHPKKQKVVVVSSAESSDDECDDDEDGDEESPAIVPTMRWEYEDTPNKWCVHRESDAIKEDAKKAKKAVTMDIDGESVSVKLDKMVQMKKGNKTVQNIRVSFADELSPAEWYVWESQEAVQAWKPYAFAIAEILESALVNKQDKFEAKIGRKMFFFDCTSMLQTEKYGLNTTTKMRRIKSNAQLVNAPLPPKPVSVVGPIPANPAATSTATKSSAANDDGQNISVRTFVLKGKVPVDPLCVSKVGNSHVYYEDDNVYDVMLNQTNLQHNNNKFYLIQLLQDDKGPNKAYSLWQRWGRVGSKGQSMLNQYEHRDAAKAAFESKFKVKTKNEWNARGDFEKFDGYYDLVKMDYNRTDVDVKSNKSKSAKKKIPVSTLESRVKSLIELICDVKAMEEAVVEMKYDAKRAPLGKLTTEQIKAGYEALKDIEDAIDRKASPPELVKACNAFYTRIPHSFGRGMPPIISSKVEILAKMQLLEALGDIQVAIKMLSESVNAHDNPVDCHYKSLGCDLKAINAKSSEYKMIEEYLNNTHEATHNMYKMQVVNVFQCNKKAETEKFIDRGNRMLLWHGSRLTNWAGILKQGLRIAPPEAPVTGYMFGKGVYFADRSSKSANYCHTTLKNNIGLLLLCEVSLGTCHELADCDYEAHHLPQCCHSVKGLGVKVPDETGNHTLPDGTVVPIGPSCQVSSSNKKLTLNYNEYVIYDTNQIKMRYLVQVRFIYH